MEIVKKDIRLLEGIYKTDGGIKFDRTYFK